MSLEINPKMILQLMTDFNRERKLFRLERLNKNKF